MNTLQKWQRTWTVMAHKQTLLPRYFAKCFETFYVLKHQAISGIYWRSPIRLHHYLYIACVTVVSCMVITIQNKKQATENEGRYFTKNSIISHHKSFSEPKNISQQKYNRTINCNDSKLIYMHLKNKKRIQLNFSKLATTVMILKWQTMLNTSKKILPYDKY